jgi:hypothetical protein
MCLFSSLTPFYPEFLPLSFCQSPKIEGLEAGLQIDCTALHGLKVRYSRGRRGQERKVHSQISRT